MIDDQFEMKCPRCGEGRLVGWDELSEEEQQVARSLPGAVDYSPGEREAIHRWCTNCWYEETEIGPCDA
jgi:hypothetical protein